MMNHRIRTISTLILTMLLSLSLLGCSAQTERGDADASAGESAQIANPILEYDSLEAAEKAAGFSFTVPEGVSVNDEDYAQYYWSTINKNLIEVRYGAEGGEVCYMRKAAASGLEDISGDYNVYDTVKTEDIVLEDGREATVTLKGQGGKFYLAIWQLRGATDNGIWDYCIGIQGVPAEDLLQLAQMVE